MTTSEELRMEADSLEKIGNKEQATRCNKLAEELESLQSKLTASECERVKMRDALELARHNFIKRWANDLDQLTGTNPLPTPYDESLSSTTPNSVEQELEELRKDKERLNDVRSYLREQARLADRSSHDRSKSGPNEQSSYRSGMWYAYHDVENRVGPQSTPAIDAAITKEAGGEE